MCDNFELLCQVLRYVLQGVHLWIQFVAIVNVFQLGECAVRDKTGRVIIFHASRTRVQQVGDTEFRVLFIVDDPHMWTSCINKCRSWCFMKCTTTKTSQSCSRCCTMQMCVFINLFNTVCTNKSTCCIKFINECPSLCF